jgi:hypothetical protein
LARPIRLFEPTLGEFNELHSGKLTKIQSCRMILAILSGSIGLICKLEQMVKRKVKEWLKRYLLAEIIGTATALSAAALVHLFTENLIYIAYGGSLGEAFGFYSTILIQSLVVERKNKLRENKLFYFSDFCKIMGHIVWEFGPAGIIDGLVLRPFFMYLFPILFKEFTLGIIFGKFAGDFTFYTLVIFSYEINKRKRKQNQI